MSIDVIEPNEIILNSVRYPILGKLQPTLVSIHPQKIVTGDYTKLSDLYKDSWVVVGDQRGGIGVEEMDEKAHANRSWWTTCQTRRGHVVLPHLATSITNPSVTAPTITNADMELDANWTNQAGTTAVSVTVFEQTFYFVIIYGQSAISCPRRTCCIRGCCIR